MNQSLRQSGGFGATPPSRTIIALIIGNVVLYALQLILLRSGGRALVEALYLTPTKVYGSGHVWQLLTYGLLHSPQDVGHVLFNMLSLWIFGGPMEQWWGRQRFLRAYVIFILAGGLLTVLVALFSELTGIPARFPDSIHLGASAATVGMTVAWGLTFSDRTFNFILIGAIKGRTIVLFVVLLEVLRALSYSNISSTAHFGGIAGAFILCRGLWRPNAWKQLFRRQSLKAKKALLERELLKLEKHKPEPPPGWKVIDGGPPKDDDPKNWN